MNRLNFQLSLKTLILFKKNKNKLKIKLLKLTNGLFLAENLLIEIKNF